MSARPTTERSFAKDLGARIVNLKSKDVGGALRNFAQLEGIRHVVLGRSAHSRDVILWRGSVINRFLSKSARRNRSGPSNGKPSRRKTGQRFAAFTESINLENEFEYTFAWRRGNKTRLLNIQVQLSTKFLETIVLRTTHLIRHFKRNPRSR